MLCVGGMGRDMRRTLIGTVALAAALSGCVEEPDAHVPANGPPAIAGGTLEVAEIDGHHVAVAADPARASVFIVDLSDNEERFRVLLNEDDEPGRVAIDEAGRAHVVGRRSGDIITIDTRTGEITDRRHACAAPRGIDIDVDGERDLYVACAEGVVVRMPLAGGGVTETVTVAPDLRDVLAQPGNVFWVSRFRSAEVIVVTDGVAGEPLPAPDGNDRPGMEATVAWRMRRSLDGQSALLIHQQSQSTQLGVLGNPALGNQYYGGSCSAGVVRSYVSRFNGRGFQGQPVENVTLAVDVAEVVVNADTGRTSLALASAAEPGTPTDTTSSRPRFNGVRSVWADSMGSSFGSGGSCDGSAAEHFGRPRAATAVARLPDDHIVAFYRDPAEIVVGRILGSEPGDFAGNNRGEDTISATISLSGGRVEHAGHALMHEAAGSGASCASCHPEGGDDGHVWQFDVGLRRTQTLTGGILDLAPFHWGGEVPDVNAVMDGTFVTRMGGAAPRADEIASFESWVDALPATPGLVADATQVERGHQVFRDAGCESCHAGEKGTNNGMAPAAVPNASGDIARLRVVSVPALYEVLYHAPYFHDGAAATLEELVVMHEGGTSLDDTQRTDLVAYLGSL